MKGHEIILNDFLNVIKCEDITNILDAGSGRTSLSMLTNSFPHTSIDAIVYPGDVRKINSIKEITDFHQTINVVEKDICSDNIDKEYDVVVAHLLLGEATKFGNAFEDLLAKVIAMQYKYLIIIDYLEDPGVKESKILEMCEENKLQIVYKAYFTNENPQVWEEFTGIHNFGYLIKRG